MENSLSIAIIAGLAGMMGWGFADFFAKKTIDKIGYITTLFWSQIIGVSVLLAAFLLNFGNNAASIKINPHDPLFLLLLGVVSGLSFLPLYAGFGKGQVSLLSPIFASFAVVVVLLSAIFFHESLTTGQQFAILIVFCGILLISGDPRDILSVLKTKADRVKGVPEVLSAMLFYAFWLVFLDKFLSGKAWLFYLLVIRLIAAMSVLVFARIKHQSLKIADRNLLKFLIIIGLFDVGAFAAVSYGFSSTTHTSIVAMLSATFSLPTIILARIFLKEKISPLQTLAAFTILVGIALVSVL